MAKKEQLFFKGLNKDSTPLLQPENTYTDNTGFRLTSNGNNSYSLESARGNIVSFVLNPGYQPIGWAWVGDHIAIQSTNSIAGAVSNGEIGVATFGALDKFPTPRYIPLYNHVDLNFSSYHQSESIIYPENTATEGNYWTDFFNPPRTLNIKNPIFKTYFASGSLVVNDQYMVVQGKVEHPLASGSFYGPNEALGTVFTASTTTYTDIGIVGFPALVIEYFSVTNLDIVPTKNIGNLFFNKWLTGGGLLTGDYQYAYRLETSDGTFTNWSYVTRPIQMATSIVPSTAVSYQAYQGLDSTNGSTNSTKGIELQINLLDTNFHKVQVAYVRSIGLHAPLPPVIFFDGVITGPSMTIAHMGGDDIEQITFADLELELIEIRKAKTLRTQKNKLFFGNIETGIAFTFDPSSATVVPFEYLVPSDVTGYQTDTIGAAPGPAVTMPLNGHIPTGTTISSGFILTDAWYIVKGTGSITYNTVVYVVGDTFQGVINKRTFAVTSGAPTVAAVIRIQKYTGVYDYHEITSDWYDEKGMATDAHIRSHWRGETYREGVLLWDKVGNPHFVRCMKDVTIPKQYQTVSGVNYRLLERHTTDTYTAAGYFSGATGAVDSLIGTSLRHIGLKVSGLNLKEISDSMGITVAELADNFSGFSIVRAPRDAQILGQGIMYPVVADGTVRYPLCANQLIDDYHYNVNGRQVQTYCWYSPDYQLRFNNLPSRIAGDFLELEDYYDESLLGGAPFGTLETNNNHFYSKYYEQQATPGGGSPKGMGNLIDVTETFEIDAGGIGNAYSPGITFDNTGRTNGGSSVGDRSSIAARTMLVVTTGTEGIGNLVNGFGYYTSGSTYRNIVNWVRPKSNLYGGTSDSAKAATQYIYSGHFQSFNDSAFMTYLVGNAGVVNDIEVWGGDCFVTIYDIARMVKDPASPSPAGAEVSLGTIYPIESNCNTFLRQGRHLSRDRSVEGAENSNGILWPSQPENFIYNDAYSHEEEDIFYSGLPVDFKDNTTFDHRVIYSETKIDGEQHDNFRVFLPNSFRDLEGSSGQINNLRRKEGRLFCWQDSGVSYLPVEERITTGSPLGQQTVLGVGGVLDRYDELKNFYGNQHQWSLCENEDGFFWFDFRRKAFMYMVGDMTELQIVKGLHAFLANAFIDGSVINDNPIDKGGITGVFDGRFKEVLMVFKTVIVDNFVGADHLCLGFDTINKQFSVQNYPIHTGILIGFNDRIFSGWATRYSPINNNTPYDVGNELNDGNSNYVCYIAYTSALVAIAPHLDSTHWKLTNSINEIYVHNEGDYGKFYGVVRDYILSFIVNPNKEDPKYFDLIQKLMNSNAFTEELYQTSFQGAQDVLLDTIGSKDYKYRDRSWYSSIPRTSDRARLVDHYMKVTLKKINMANGDPTVSKNELIQLVGVIIDYHKAF